MKERAVRFFNLIIYWSLIFIPFSIAIAPAFTFSSIGILVFFFTLKKLISKEKLFINTPLNLPFLFLVVISILSFVNSVDYWDSLMGISKWLQRILVCLICAEEIKDKRHIKRIVISIIIGACLASFDAVWQIIFGKDFIRGNAPMVFIGIKRATAAFNHTNVLGVYLSAIVPLVVGLTLYYFKGRNKIIMLLASALAVCGLLLTFSRGAGLGAYLAVLLTGIFRRKRIVIAVMLIILLIFPFIMPQNIRDWAKSVNYNPIIFMLNPERVTIYQNALKMIKAHPFLGVGVNTFSRNYGPYAHNIFLHMGAEIGLLGLGGFIWLLFRMFKKNIYIYRNLKDEYLKIVSLCLMACVLAFLINGLTETSLYYPRVAVIFWYLAGFSLGLDKFASDKRS